VVYHWGLLNIKAGVVVFQVDSVFENQHPIYLFSSTGVSLKKYDWIYPIRDTFRSRVYAENFRPIFYERHTTEGDYSAHNISYFKPEDKLIQMELDNSKDGYRIRSLAYAPTILDLQTAVYFARLLDFQNAVMGDEYNFDIIIDGQQYQLPIHYEGKEVIQLNKNHSYSCYRISTEVIEGTIFESSQKIMVWVSDDGKQTPIKVAAPIKVGQVEALLKIE
jgi:hypothetical protein